MFHSMLQPLESRRYFNSVGGTVFNDRNNDATYQPAGPDIPLGGVTVYLDVNQNGQLDSGEPTTVSAGITSGMAGQYQFDNAGVGTFHLRAIAPDHYAQTLPINNGEQVVTITNPNISN